jgi:hypothetical protein
METFWKRNSAKILRKKRAKKGKKGQKTSKKRAKNEQKRAIDFYCEIVLINAVKNK